MIKTAVFKTVACFFLVGILILNIPCAFAHPTSQEGILAETYTAQYDGYYIGGEDVGWSIDEDHHTYGRMITYSFSSEDSHLTSTYKSYVENGANKWSSVVKITNKTDGSGQGQIRTVYNPNMNIGAALSGFVVDSYGHFTAWEMVLNRAYTQSAVGAAHEFGHAIGLNDLYESKNIGKLMYGVVSRTATGPTTSDILGAELIIGVHTSHTWGYKFWTTNSLGNVHIKYCTGCQGLTSTTGACRYGSGSTCIVCGSGMYVPID